jgi:V/A-type H+/Na+-transporting ATPase subunit E
MSLEEIRKSIDKDAESRADSIREEGASAAAAMIKEARARAAVILKAAKEDAEKEAERIKRERLSGVQMEISSMIFSAKESVLEKQMDGVKRRVASQLAGKRLEKVIAEAAKQFSKFAPEHQMVVRTGKKNAALVKKLGYSVVLGAGDDLRLESKDGSVSIDASPNGLAERHGAEAKGLLAARLWKVKG